MKKREYVVRVTIPEIDRGVIPLAQQVDKGFMECLRYAGVIRIYDYNNADQVFDILAPRKTSSKEWSEMNAERMRTFGYNAVSAPRYEG